MSLTIAELPAALREAGRRRAEALGTSGERAHRPEGGQAPTGAARRLPFPAQMRAKLVDRNGKKMHEVSGYATVFNKPYEMWDMFGPYEEEVADGAADDTLKAGPDVAFLVNHRGITMARTTNGTLELSADQHGLRDLAWLNPERQDVRDLTSAISDELVTEQSFAFMITEGWWNEDFTKFRIISFDINRGDVSAVNYGANPYTSIAARSREIMAELEHAPLGLARAALERLRHRPDLQDPAADSQTPAATAPQPADQTGNGQPQEGRSVAFWTSMLLADDD